ncbi:AIPR family protein [uncultured Brevundimonas sp.]|uniref:AIPR family protein n=1 Tax=uncultured Brevundimonas sp. TaxID=213418 RepID=UPI0030ECD2BE|tara:strand:- start:1562 stop:3232 length:1671 start_codon:yes stop_codon:yes gene_type:complete
MPKLSKLDWDLINARIRSVATQHQLKNPAAGLLWLALQQYFPAQDTAFQELITDGPDDRGVDAIHLVGDDDAVTVYIFQSKARESIDGTIKTINVDEVLKTTSFISQLINKSEDLKRCGNLRLREAIERIWGLHEAGTYCSYELVFVSNDSGLGEAAKANLKSFTAEHTQVRFAQYAALDLIRDLSRSRKEAEDGQLQAISKEIFERSDGDIRGLVANVDARSLIALITDNDNLTVKRHIFDDNLRVYLGSNSGYNGQIVETATSTSDSHLFWYLNNGITITCREYSYNKGHPNPIISIRDLQIVNGAQTSHSLVEAAKQGGDSLENVVVSVKIYATGRTDIAERVAVATNSQARIHGRDLRANTPIMKKYETLFREREIFFERKRNMHADRPDSQRLDALKLGQIILSYVLREPDSARTSSDAIFDSRFQSIFNDNNDIDELVRLTQFYSKIETLRDEVSAKYGDHIESSGDLQYLIFGHWYILFAARLILAKGNAPFPDAENDDKLLREAISVVARACDQTKHVAHYQMFRSARTKEKIAAEISGKQLELFVNS